MAFTITTNRNTLVKHFATLFYHLTTNARIMYTITLDDLEIEHGTAILSDLTGQHLTRNQQPVRLFDQTRHSSEFYYRADAQGKPYIQDHQNSKRWYPVTAYAEVYGVDFVTAQSDICQRYYDEADTTNQRTRRPQRPIVPPPPVDYLPADQYEPCRTQFGRNGLYAYLSFTYGHESADAVFARYRLGTSRRWKYYGYLATCFPQFDVSGNLRQVKVMPFDGMNGRRVKKHQQAWQFNLQRQVYEPTESDSDKTYFAGKRIAKGAGRPDVNLQQCFFGEHLLTELPNLPVAIVEGESTALACSILYGQYVWLATGGKNGARWTDPETFGVLHGRDVTLWPDNDAYANWLEKSEPLRPLVKSLRVTEYVGKNAPVGMQKADLRDLITRPNWIRAGQMIYGEPLTVELSDHYPPEWDAPNLTGTMPRIRALSVDQWR